MRTINEMRHNILSAVRQSSLLLIVLVIPLIANAQSALDGFDPNTNGAVQTIVEDRTGKILIGGDFTSVLGIPRNRVARLNPSGSVDLTFNPNINGTVFSIVIQPDNKILIGGNFSIVGGSSVGTLVRLENDGSVDASFLPAVNAMVRTIVLPPTGKILIGGNFTFVGNALRNRIARLDPSDGQADSFDPDANGNVHTIAVDSSGRILVGGLFESIGGQIRNGIARLNSMTGAADSFDPNAPVLGVFSIVVQPNRKILVGGGFTSIGGQVRRRIARLDPNTGLADSFNPNVPGGTESGVQVSSIVLQTNGKIVAAGFFGNIGGQNRGGLARLDPTTGLVDSFDPNPNGVVYSLMQQSNGKLLAGGTFSSLSANGGSSVNRNNLARLENDGRVDRTLVVFDLFGTVNVIVPEPTGKVLIGGSFTSVSGVPRNRIARLNPDGSLDAGFNPNADDNITSIALQKNGKIVVGGGFTIIGGQSRNGLARLDTVTGTADSFDPNPNGSIFSIAVQSDQKILVSGSFSAVGGEFRNHLARLDPISGLADLFSPDPNNFIFSIVEQRNGKILIGGIFTFIGGQPNTFLARLESDGTLDNAFSPNADERVLTITIQIDDKILVGGDFASIGGQTRNRMARLETDGSADLTFDPDSSGRVNAIAVQSNGKIIAGGDFNFIGGQPRNRIARLNETTGAAELLNGSPDSFDPNADGAVGAIAIQADGKILTGGDFFTIGGQPRTFLARLTNDTSAGFELTVTKTAVSWTLKGSTPQMSRIIFEISTDGGANYTILGEGVPDFTSRMAAETRKGGERPLPPVNGPMTFTLSGLNLPAGQDILIRATGQAASSGSNSPLESVQSAFLLAPTAANVSISGRVFYSANGGLNNASVSITDSLGNMRNTRTNTFGYYRFDGIEAGQTVVIDIFSKQHQFETRVLMVGEDLTGIDFVPINGNSGRK